MATKKTTNRAVLATDSTHEPTAETDRVRVRATQDFNEPTGHARAAGEVFETTLDWAQTLGANVEPAE